MKLKIYLAFLLFTPSVGMFAQSQQDIFEFFKNRVEEFAITKKTKVKLEGCQMKYLYERTLLGNPPWTEELSFSLKNVTDIFFIYRDETSVISIRLKDEDLIITDIEQNGTRNFLAYDTGMRFVFQKGLVTKEEGRKLADLFKKLAKQCGAKIIEL